MKIALEKKNIWARFDTFLGMGLVVSVFCLIFVIAHRAIFDLDIWLHLKAGQFILENKTVPLRDIFSFSFPNKPWIDHEWLFQIINYFWYSKWQLSGLADLESYILILAFFVLFVMGYRNLRSYTAVAAFMTLALYSSIARFNIRPDIFSLLLFIAYLYILKFDISKKRIWFLVLLQLFWVNLHGYFFLGPLLITLFIFAESVRRNVVLPWEWAKVGVLRDDAYTRLKQVLAASIAVSFINPSGATGVFYPLGIFQELILRKNQIFFSHIQELKPTFGVVKNFNDPYYILIFFCLLLFVINFRRLKIVDMLLFIFFFLFSLTIRNIAFFAFAAYAIITFYCRPSTIKTVFNKVKLHIPFKRSFYLPLGFILTVCLLFFVWARANTVLNQSRYFDFNENKYKSNIAELNQGRYPKKAVEFILENKLPQRMFNDFNSGAYLIGTAYPQRKVFIDGRTEYYGAEFFKECSDAVKGDAAAMRRLVNEFDLSAILVSTTNYIPKIINWLYRSPEWRLVFLDESALVFLKEDPANKDLIAKFGIDLKEYSAPVADLRALGIRRVYPEPFIKRANIFNVLGLSDQCIAEAEQALRISPNSFYANLLLGKSYMRKKLYPEAFIYLRAAVLLSTNNVEALTDLGSCLMEQKEEKFAKDALEGAIKINRRYAPAYYQLGLLYLSTQENKKALQALNSAIRLSPQESLYHLKLAEALFRAGAQGPDSVSNFVKARAELKKAQRLNVGEDKEIADEISRKLKELKI